MYIFIKKNMHYAKILNNEIKQAKKLNYEYVKDLSHDIYQWT